MRTAALVAVAGLLVAYVASLGAFFGQIAQRTGPTPVGGHDAIIVLTGGGQRIAAGLSLLSAGVAPRLYVTGVHPDVTIADLIRLGGGPVDPSICCIEVDYLARDTVGNAREASIWVRRHHVRSIVLVTANYHMPRSRVAFRRALHDVAVMPYAVVPKGMEGRAWWRDSGTVGLLLREHLKWVLTLAAGIVARPAADAPLSGI